MAKIGYIKHSFIGRSPVGRGDGELSCLPDTGRRSLSLNYRLLMKLRAQASYRGMSCLLDILDCSYLGECFYCGVVADSLKLITPQSGYTRREMDAVCSICGEMVGKEGRVMFLDRIRGIVDHQNL